MAIPALEKAIHQANAMVEVSTAAARTHATKNPLAQGSTLGASGFGGDRKSADLYKHNRGWVYSSVRAIAQRGAGQTIRMARIAETGTQRSAFNQKSLELTLSKAPSFVRDKGLRLELIEQHSLLDGLSDPNEEMVAWSLMYVTLASLELTGKSYWWVYPDRNRASGFAFWPLPSHWVTPNHSKGLFSSFDISIGGGPPKSVPAREMYFVHYPDPSNPLGALGPLEAQGRAVSADESIQESQARAFKNGIFPGLMLQLGKVTGADGVDRRPLLEREQREQIITAVKQMYRGAMRFDEPFILDALINDVKKVSHTPNEMDFLASGKGTKNRINLGFGVNTTSIGEVEGVNRASSTVADEHFCDNTVNPKLDLISQTMTKFFQPLFGSERILVWVERCRPNDPDQIRKDLSLGVKYAAVTRNEIRAAIGLPPMVGGSSVVMPLNSELQEVEVDESIHLRRSPAPRKHVPMATRELVGFMQKQSQDHEDRMAGALSRFFSAFAEDYLKTLQRYVEDLSESATDASLIVDSTFDLHDFTEKVMEVISPRVEESLVAGAATEWRTFQDRAKSKKPTKSAMRKLATALKMDDLSTIEAFLFAQALPKEIINAIKAELVKILEAPYWSALAQTVRSQMTSALAAGIAVGENFSGFAIRLREVLGDISRYRAETIARTEAGGALNAGHDASRQFLGDAGIVTGKRWISVIDTVTRQEPAADHVVMHGAKTAYNGMFSVEPTKELAPYPKHHGLSVKQRIRCRCRTISVFPQFEAEDDAMFQAELQEFESVELILP